VTAQAVAEAIRTAVREFGTHGCADVMAQEFGEHPEAAVERMRWVRRLLIDHPITVARTRHCSSV
jgi:hypothetical protein